MRSQAILSISSLSLLLPPLFLYSLSIVRVTTLSQIGTTLVRTGANLTPGRFESPWVLPLHEKNIGSSRFANRKPETGSYKILKLDLTYIDVAPETLVVRKYGIT